MKPLSSVGPLLRALAQPFLLDPSTSDEPSAPLTSSSGSSGPSSASFATAPYPPPSSSPPRGSASSLRSSLQRSSSPSSSFPCVAAPAVDRADAPPFSLPPLLCATPGATLAPPPVGASAPFPAAVATSSSPPRRVARRLSAAPRALAVPAAAAPEALLQVPDGSAVGLVAPASCATAAPPAAASAAASRAMNGMNAGSTAGMGLSPVDHGRLGPGLGNFEGADWMHCSAASLPSQQQQQQQQQKQLQQQHVSADYVSHQKAASLQHLQRLQTPSGVASSSVTCGGTEVSPTTPGPAVGDRRRDRSGQSSEASDATHPEADMAARCSDWNDAAARAAQPSHRFPQTSSPAGAVPVASMPTPSSGVSTAATAYPSGSTASAFSRAGSFANVTAEGRINSATTRSLSITSAALPRASQGGFGAAAVNAPAVATVPAPAVAPAAPAGALHTALAHGIPARAPASSSPATGSVAATVAAAAAAASTASPATPAAAPQLPPGARSTPSNRPANSSLPKPTTEAVEDPHAVPGYLLGDEIGRGGFSVVRKARHLATGRQVAVKVVDRARLRSARDAARVERELRLMRALGDHARCARLLDSLSTDKAVYAVTDLIPNGSLLDAVRQRRRLPEPEAAGILRDLVDALAHCSSRGVTHRDVKLENVLFDAQGRAVLIDFGLAAASAPGSRLRSHCGSPSYAAPEIVARRDYEGPPVDVWSLGVVLFAMLAGHLPFHAEPDDRRALSAAILAGRYRMPSHVSSQAADLVARMLQPRPQERATLADVAAHPWTLQRDERGQPPPLRWTPGAEARDARYPASPSGEPLADPRAVEVMRAAGVDPARVRRHVRARAASYVASTHHVLVAAMDDDRVDPAGLAVDAAIFADADRRAKQLRREADEAAAMGGWEARRRAIQSQQQAHQQAQQLAQQQAQAQAQQQALAQAQAHAHAHAQAQAQQQAQAHAQAQAQAQAQYYAHRHSHSQAAGSHHVPRSPSGAPSQGVPVSLVHSSSAAPAPCATSAPVERRGSSYSSTATEVPSPTAARRTSSGVWRSGVRAAARILRVSVGAGNDDETRSPAAGRAAAEARARQRVAPAASSADSGSSSAATCEDDAPSPEDPASPEKRRTHHETALQREVPIWDWTRTL